MSEDAPYLKNAERHTAKYKATYKTHKRHKKPPECRAHPTRMFHRVLRARHAGGFFVPLISSLRLG